MHKLNRSGILGTIAAAIFSLAAYSGMAFGDQVKVMLSGDQEVPAVKTAASGSGTITINADMTVSGSVTTAGLAGTAAHIHMAGAGKNGPVAVPLTKSADNTWSVAPGAKLNDAQFAAFWGRESLR